jgi:hypothetical protein
LYNQTRTEIESNNRHFLYFDRIKL